MQQFPKVDFSDMSEAHIEIVRKALKAAARELERRVDDEDNRCLFLCHDITRLYTGSLGYMFTDQVPSDIWGVATKACNAFRKAVTDALDLSHLGYDGDRIVANENVVDMFGIGGWQLARDIKADECVNMNEKYVLINECGHAIHSYQQYYDLGNEAKAALHANTFRLGWVNDMLNRINAI